MYVVEYCLWGVAHVLRVFFAKWTNLVFGGKKKFLRPPTYAHQIGRYVGLFRMQYSDRFLPNYQDGELTWPEVAWWISDCCFEGVNSTLEMQRSSTIKYMVTIMENGAPVMPR